MLNENEILNRINDEHANEIDPTTAKINADKLETVNELIKCITQIEMGNKGSLIKCEYDPTDENTGSPNWSAYITVPPAFVVAKNGLMMDSEYNAWKTLLTKADNIILFTGATIGGNIRLALSVMGLWEA